MIQCYYGDGKGKTCSAVGCALRAVGGGMRVLFVQFLKNADSSELKAIEKIHGIDFLFPSVGYTMFEPLDEHRIAVRAQSYNELLFKKLPEYLEEYQMIVLDEILDAIEFNYISEIKLIKMLVENKSGTEFVITGHNITECVFEISDYISEIKEVKHPFNYGVASRKGIEY